MELVYTNLKQELYGDSVKSFEKAIKQVWASVWNESSYWEREIFGLNQSNIAMGVLVHRSFPDELANGVVITKNLFRKDFEWHNSKYSKRRKFRCKTQ